MGRVYLCLGRNAELPYFFEKARVHVWNVEELCYFIRENAWLLERGMLGEPLIEWIGQQCMLKNLALSLRSALQESDPVAAFAERLFVYTGYCSAEEAVQVKKALSLNENSSAEERAKARGDYFLENGKYMLAVREYETLLEGLTGVKPELVGKVCHNVGTAYAKLFLFEQAASFYERAWKLLRDKRCAEQYMAALRMSVSEQEYVDFLAEHPELYEISMALEEKLKSCRAEWEESEERALSSKLARQRQNGEAVKVLEAVDESCRALQQQYREFVAL